MRRAANVGLLALGLGIATIIAMVVAVPALSGTRPVTITTNSMAPTLPVGSLAYITPFDEYPIGSIITFNHNGNVISHQVVGHLPNPATGKPDGSLLQTKGTNNRDIDPWAVNRDQVIGRVVYSIPIAGMVVDTLSALPLQIFILTLAVALYWLGRPPAPRLAPQPARQ